MPSALESPWVTLEVNDVPLSLCNDLGRPNLGMISWSSFLTTFSAFSVQVGKPSIHPVNVSIITNRYKYLLVMIDKFTGLIEGFPIQIEKAEEVVKKKKNCSLK